MELDYYAIGQKIRKIRKARGITQEELAEQVNISTTHMSHIETGNTKLSLAVLVDLALALETRTDEILFEDNPLNRSAAIDAIVHALDTCTTQQIKIIEDLITAAKISLDQHM